MKVRIIISFRLGFIDLLLLQLEAKSLHHFMSNEYFPNKIGMQVSMVVH